MVASLTLLTYITIAVISATSGRGVTPEVTLIRVYKERMVASLTLLTYITIAVISATSGRGVTPEVTRVYKERLPSAPPLSTTAVAAVLKKRSPRFSSFFLH